MKHSITLNDEECDACHKKFDDKQLKNQDTCISKQVTMPCKVGLSDNHYYSFQSEYYLDLGDLCQECRIKLFNAVRVKFPHAKLEKRND